jgi:SAM-dependent methyltransferase
MAISTYNDIDWELLRVNALRNKGWQTRKPADWDAKAGSFSSRNKTTEYTERLLCQLPLQPEFTVLDIGSGPGTLAIPIAKKVKKVTAIDFSPVMLSHLNSFAQDEHLDNIVTERLAWEDDWSGKIVPHDIAIASRSMAVSALTEALRKIDAYALRYVFITDRITSTPFDAAAFAALGRHFDPGPDYIFTVNILYSMGIYANIEVLQLDCDSIYQSLEDAFQSYQWMFKEMTVAETQALYRYLERKATPMPDGRIKITKDEPPRWALIWWKKNASSPAISKGKLS